MLKHKDYSFFHTQEWAKVIIDSYNYSPSYFCIIEKNSLNAVLPSFIIKSKITGKRIVSLPFSDYCEPLYSNASSIDLIKNKLFSFAKNQGLDYIELKTLNNLCTIDINNCNIDLNHVLKLDQKEKDLLSFFSENTKRNIKKAFKENVIVNVFNNKNGIELFYEMFCNTRKKHGLPPQPLDFFLNIYKHIIVKGLGDIIIAEHNNKTIAGAVYFKFGKKVLYKFGASYEKFKEYRGNNAVMWFAIKKYLNENLAQLDFGKTEMCHEGLRKYKLGWHTDEYQIYTKRFNIKPESFTQNRLKTEGFYNKLFSKTPIPVLKFIGKSLYKHIG